jgi:hypothetical protein
MNWKVRYYDREGKFLSMHLIKDRAESEAFKEAIADMPMECEDWSLTKSGARFRGEFKKAVA